MSRSTVSRITRQLDGRIEALRTALIPDRSPPAIPTPPARRCAGCAAPCIRSQHAPSALPPASPVPRALAAVRSREHLGPCSGSRPGLVVLASASGRMARHGRGVPCRESPGAGRPGCRKSGRGDWMRRRPAGRPVVGVKAAAGADDSPEVSSVPRGPLCRRRRPSTSRPRAPGGRTPAGGQPRRAGWPRQCRRGEPPRSHARRPPDSHPRRRSVSVRMPRRRPSSTTGSALIR